MRLRLLARADRLVELATLGAYGLADDGGLLTLEPVPAPVVARLRHGCPEPPGSARPEAARLRRGGECAPSPAGCSGASPRA